MHFVRLQEEELPVATHVPFARSRQMQAINYGSTQSKPIQTLQRSQDPQRRLMRKNYSSRKRTSISIGQGFVGILRARAQLGHSLVSFKSNLLTFCESGRTRPARLQPADPCQSRLPITKLLSRKNLQRNCGPSVLNDRSLHPTTH